MSNVKKFKVEELNAQKSTKNRVHIYTFNVYNLALVIINELI